MFEELTSELEKVLDKAVSLGISYADIRYQRDDYEEITIENRALRSYSPRSHSGVGIRVTVKGSIGFASTNDLNRKSLEKALDNAIKAAKSIKGREQTFSEAKINKTHAKVSIKTDPMDVSPEEKISLTLDANKAAWISDEIKSVMTRLGLSKDFRLFMSSEGAEVSAETTLVGLAQASVARVNGVMERALHQESMCAGFEFISSKDWNSFATEISELAIEAASSKTLPPGTYPVVVNPKTVGLVLHEAFGHASEGDYVYTGDSVLANRLGGEVASESVTIIDEGIVEGGFFLPFDDEGTEKERTIIVEDGVLKNYIHDKNSALQFGVESTGNGRAQDFENIPVVRQTNYYLQPRDYKFEELIEDIDYGIYLRGKGGNGGQVEVGMGTFTFSVGPSKVIRKGELA
ncbi:MAG: TldD/PmbA family protein, partial [Candidatus Bathyarchaeia archaeon]